MTRLIIKSYRQKRPYSDITGSIYFSRWFLKSRVACSKISEKFLIEDDTRSPYFQKLFFGLLKYIKVLTTFLISNCLSELIKVWKEKYILLC